MVKWQWWVGMISIDYHDTVHVPPGLGFFFEHRLSTRTVYCTCRANTRKYLVNILISAKFVVYKFRYSVVCAKRAESILTHFNTQSIFTMLISPGWILNWLFEGVLIGIPIWSHSLLRGKWDIQGTKIAFFEMFSFYTD